MGKPDLVDLLRGYAGVLQMYTFLRAVERYGMTPRPRPVPRRTPFDSRRVASVQRVPRWVLALRFVANFDLPRRV